jgi:hypothetical protein
LKEENLTLQRRLNDIIIQNESLRAALKEAHLKIFDPENPTWDNLPFPWLVSLSVPNTVVFGTYFAMHKNNEVAVNLSDDMDCDIADLTLIPRSQWPQLLIDQYVKETGEKPIHF